MMNTEISVIIVNFFSEEEIIKCCSSIQKMTSEHNYELIIVSNSELKTDFTSRIDSFDFPVKLIQCESNLGYGKACNLGASNAIGDYLFFLNPDTIFKNDVLNELKKCSAKKPHSGILGPKTFTVNDELFPSAKHHLSLKYYLTLLFPFLTPFFENTSRNNLFSPESSQAVPVLNGHALFLKKVLFNELEGFDERYFMYWEENDLCLRATNMDFRNYFCSNAELIHISGTSTSPFFLNMEIEKHRSQKTFVLTHHPSWNLLNRISGIIGYSWRLIGSLFTFNSMKFKQFWTLLKWYTFYYK